MIAQAIYLLCAGTSLGCAGLLFQSFRTNGTRLLFWSSLCFLALAVNNLMLFADVYLVPDVAPLFAVARNAVAVAGLTSLLYGLVWEVR